MSTKAKTKVIQLPKAVRLPKIVEYVADNKEHAWRLESPNGQTMATPHETFKKKGYIKQSVHKVAVGMLLALNKEQFMAVIMEVNRVNVQIVNQREPKIESDGK